MSGIKKDKIWTTIKQGNAIGRIITVNLTEGERYYLRLLLNHVWGATSFQDLPVVNGVKTSSFRNSALLHGLLDDDNNLDLCFEEASLYQMPYTLRHLFATLLVYCNVNNPKKLWEKFENAMSEDYSRLNISRVDIRIKVLQNLNSILEPIGKNINDFHLVNFNIKISEEENYMREIKIN